MSTHVPGSSPEKIGENLAENLAENVAENVDTSESRLFDLSLYDYSLPSSLIAQSPMEPRDHSRLLVLHRSEKRLEHRRFDELPQFLDLHDLVVANNTRVLRARLTGRRLVQDPKNPSKEIESGKVEFLLLEEHSPLVWEGAFHAAAKHKPGIRFRIPTPDGRGIVGELVRGASDSRSGTVEARFDRDPIGAGAGEIPLPHYIEHLPTKSEEARYNTIYAQNSGSAAAPTAGLHFTDRVIAECRKKTAGWEEVTLHVGLGTFRPVKTADIRQHVMHEERYALSSEAAVKISNHKSQGGRILAVGTTVVRALESAYEPTTRSVRPGPGRTDIFIHPGGKTPQLVDRLLTNFHLPKSTLLMLVSSFADREWVLAAYREAVAQKYRFYSYGDAMLIL